MPKLLDFDEFCKDLPEVKSLKIIDKKKFHESGLFSEQIFGPIKNYTCQCGIYHGVSKSGGTCKMCKVDIVNNDERRKRFAKITLPIPLLNPLIYDLLISIGGGNLKILLDRLIRRDTSVLYIDEYGEPRVALRQEEIPPNTRTWERTEAIYKLVEYVSSVLKDGETKWQLIYDNLDKVLVNYVIVLPPDLRPAAKGITRNNQVLDKINRYYVQILTKKEIMRDTVIDIQRDKKLFYNYFSQLQSDAQELYKHILEKLSKKEGLIRGNILGKRIDFSGRGIIVPDPTLKLDECSLPYLMFLEIFKLPVAKKLIEIGKFKLLNKAIDFVDDCINRNSQVLYNLCEQLSEGEICILNRQPSLHRLGMLAFNIKINPDFVIKIPPLICPPFNADFDGDQMAVYIPVSEEAKQEAREKMFVTENLLSPSNQSLTTTPSQDIILGIYSITSEKFPELSNKVEFKGKEITEGQKIFNECLPEDYPLVEEPVAKKKLIEILNDIAFRYDHSITKNVLDNIKLVGFKYSTIFGATMSLDGCLFDGASDIRDSLYNSDDIRQQLEDVSSQNTIKQLKDKFNYSYMVESGARGSWDQVKQIILTRGFISNFNGEILPVPIKHSLSEGLTEEEFFTSTYGCRKGLLDVALNTGSSGYLSRKLIFTCANLQIDLNTDDCGTTDCLEIHIDTEHKAKMLVNRYFLKDTQLQQITLDNYKDFVGQTLLFRSPIFCKNEKICKTCYGDLYKILHSRFIGIIAAQTLGERSTQLVLRTFHTSGSAIFRGEKSEEDHSSTLRQMDIIGDLSAVSSMLHKFKNKNYKMIVDELFKVYASDRDIHHIHFECVVSQLMWNSGRKWRLLENRDKLEPKYYSVQSVPSHESWILGLAFSNPKRHIIRGIMNSGHYKGIMDKILLGEKI